MKLLDPSSTPLVILTEGYLGSRQAKTATGVMRYGNWPISSVIDSKSAGKSILDLTGINCSAPIVASIEEALLLKPQALLLGIAPIGGDLPESWMTIIKTAISNGLHIINGLHMFLEDIPAIKNLANTNNVILWDVRNPKFYTASKDNYVAKQLPRPAGVKVITMVGSDCNVGKMCTALELDSTLKQTGAKSSFVATGQTGIMISGNGIPLDRIICDFAAGAMEKSISDVIARAPGVANGDEASEKSEHIILVEGQGSLLHPGYSGVTLSLLHGSNPDAMILCHKAGNDTILGGYSVKIPSMSRLIEIYEEAANWIDLGTKPKARVIGISVNTSALNETDARSYLQTIEQETSLPAVDMIRFGGHEKLTLSLQKHEARQSNLVKTQNDATKL